ncbi:hypothetical protein J6590_101770 [Homalodisca vitripennis]|nr:hypothetical protein J6590_101770 [Homalodisca vitripennis]
MKQLRHLLEMQRDTKLARFPRPVYMWCTRGSGGCDVRRTTASLSIGVLARHRRRTLVNVTLLGPAREETPQHPPHPHSLSIVFLTLPTCSVNALSPQTAGKLEGS